MANTGNLKILLMTGGSAWLRHTARAFCNRGLLAGLFISDKNTTGLPAELYRRCWPFHLAMKPLYHLAPQIVVEKSVYRLFPLWTNWVRRQKLPPLTVMQALMGWATEAFDHADQVGALKVLDCQNSHPTTFYGFWQRECDLWCPGERVPIPWWMFGRMNREMDRADLIIAQSKFCKESMVQNGIPESKIIVNGMGVDATIFTKRVTLPERPRFIAVGTICLRKGHQYLFRAFQLVKRRLPEAELICVGEFKHDFRMERPRWEGTFTHFAQLPQEEVGKLLRTCTAFVFPSQEEGIARAQVEALGSGLPVIGTHEGGATTLVEDGVEGFIVRGRDPEHIAEAMIKLALDPELNRRMGEAAYRKGAVGNTWQDYGDRLITEYQRRLQRHSG